MRSTNWWQGLSELDRRALRRRLRLRDEVIVARFEEPVGDEGPVPSDFYEYLVGHEVYLEDGRTFRICTAHAQARAVVAQGRIPYEFRCPRAEAGCPMRRLLAEGAGRDCVLRVVVVAAGGAR